MQLKGIVVTIIVALFGIYVYNNLTKCVNSLTEVESCPFCFGQDLCEPFIHNRIQLKSINGITDWFLNNFGSKNVYTAKYDSENVILKQLANSNELESIYKSFPLNGFKLDGNADDLKIKILKYLSHDDNQVRSLKICSVEDADALLNYFLQKNKDVTNEKELLANIWTIVHVNPEPLILQLLKSEVENWPVPKYLGACGRVIVEEHCGKNLNHFEHSPWRFRAKLALQLLKAARNFTFDHLDFRFYLTDISPDNICVNEDEETTGDGAKVKFIDLENIIMKRKLETFEEISAIEHMHRSEDMDCPDCFAYSEAEICKNEVSDHNFYAVCKLLLSEHAPWPMFPNGLLHSPPKVLLQNYTYVAELIESCVRPEFNVSRFVIVEELLNVLDLIIDNV